MEFPPLPDWFWYPITFLYGAIVGSFLNVVIYRLPLGKSINGSSACPNCNYELRLRDNIPIVGFLALGGKCRLCRTPISWRYISVELVTGCLWVALYDRIANTTSISWVDCVFQALFASVLIAMVFIDLDHFIAPDELNVVGFLLAIARDGICLALAWNAHSYVWGQALSDFTYFHFLPRALVGALVYGGILFVVSVGGFLYYAREPGETVGQALRRYAIYYLLSDWLKKLFPALRVAEQEQIEKEENYIAAAEAERVLSEVEEEEAEEAPFRLRFSPGFLATISAVLLATVTGAWGVLALVIPALSFVVFARRAGETPSATLLRFFKSDEEDNYARADGANADPDHLAASDEADAFAREAETGVHGGMGLGDVKLALAIGALLGPVLASLSLLVATFLGAVTGIAIKLRLRRPDLRFGVPFVPFMAAGAIVTMLYGNQFIDWYMRLLTPPDQTRMVNPYPPRPVRPAHPRGDARGRAELPPPNATP